MRRIPALLLAAVTIATTPSVTGSWEGKMNGAKAVTLSLSENSGKVDGRAVFYIIRSESDGKPVNGSPAAFPILKTEWDGRLLRFSVVNSEGETVKFEMKLLGAASASLSRLGDEPVTIPLVRLEK